MMSVGEAERHHSVQIETFRDTNADFVSALTMTYVDEAIGIVRATQTAGLPAVISFTVETDGRLPSGVTRKDAVEGVDQATERAPVLLYDQLCPSHTLCK
jgi:S-methylmethionine-dependent homocysteine/selenocysteine methylase